MKMLKRDQQLFEVFKPNYVTDNDGDITVFYDEPSHEFFGNLQHFRTDEKVQMFGIDTKKVFWVYTDDKFVQQLDRIACNQMRYDVLLVQDWSSYYKILAEKVN